MLATPLVWLLLAAAPGGLWSWATGGRGGGATAPARGIIIAGRILLAGALHDLGLAVVLDALGVHLQACAAAWAVSLVLPLGLALGRTLRRGERRSRLRLADPGLTLVTLLVTLMLSAWIAATPPPLNIATDAPAHLGAIRDALSTAQLRPPDHSFDETQRRSDPRFGLAHGVYALLARGLGADPADVWARAPVALGPLFLLAHAWLFVAIGLPGPWALLAALLLAIGGAGGRAYGVWSAGYPAQIAVSLAALGLAAWIEDWLPDDASGEHPGAPGARIARWRGPALVAFTAPVHPLGWVATCALVAHAAGLCALRPATRGRARPLLASLLGAAGLGALLMLPQLTQRGASNAGLHAVVTDALFVGGGLFVVDPLVLAYWSGWGSMVAFPLVLLQAGSFWRRPRRLAALAGAAMMWTVCLDPLVQPLAWSAISYLSVRLGRMAWTPALWILLLAFGAQALRSSGRPRPRARGLLAAGLALVLLLSEVRLTAQALRVGPDAANPVEWRRFAAMAAALDELPHGRVASDPRTSYAVRGLRGGAMPVYPVAHASPVDTGLVGRLTVYRSLFSPVRTPVRITAALDSLGARYLLINERVEAISGVGDFGFVASDGAQRELVQWLHGLGVPPRRQGEGWELFDAGDLHSPTQAWQAPPGARSLQLQGPAGLDPAGLLARPVDGSRIAVVGIRPLQEQVAAGGRLAVQIWYAPAHGPARTIHPGWERFNLRFEGPMPAVPRVLAPVSKLVRKFLIEDSGRSLARFNGSWVPFDGVWPPTEWPAEGASEVREIRVPPYVRPGRYVLELTVQEAVWRQRRDLRDYLSDRDRWSGPSVGVVEIQSPHPATAGEPVPDRP